MDNKQSRSVATKEMLTAAVPAVVLFGTAYLLGYLTTPGLSFLTFLDIQDYLNSAAAFLPAVAVWFAFVFAAARFSHHKEGNRELDRIQTPAQIEARKKNDGWDPNDVLFNYESGTWRDDRAFLLKAATLLSFLAFFGTFVALLFGVEAPLLLLWLTVFLFAITGQWLLSYFSERYDNGVHTIFLVGAMLGLYVFAYGVTASRLDAGGRTEHFVSMKGGYVVGVTALRRMGQHLLVYDTNSKAWILLPQSEVLSISESTT